mgnify:CR=1 FL=1
MFDRSLRSSSSSLLVALRGMMAGRVAALALVLAAGAAAMSCEWYPLWPYPANCTAGDLYNYVSVVA